MFFADDVAVSWQQRAKFIGGRNGRDNQALAGEVIQCRQNFTGGIAEIVQIDLLIIRDLFFIRNLI